MKLELTIEGMSCGHCVSHVKTALSELEGATNISVDLATKIALVEFEQSGVPEDALKNAIEDAGFELVSIATL